MSQLRSYSFLRFHQSIDPMFHRSIPEFPLDTCPVSPDYLVGAEQN
jgi:hypothetical protein